MTKLIQVLLAMAACLVVVVAAGRTLAAVLHALAPLVAVIGVTVAVLRLVWFYTRR